MREPGRRAALILWLGLPTPVAQFFPRVSEKPQCFSSRDFLLAEVSPSTFILLGSKKKPSIVFFSLKISIEMKFTNVK